MKKTDEYRLGRIVSVGRQLMAAVDEEGITEEKILTDTRTQWLITTPLYNIGEQAYSVSREYKEGHPEIPWSAIAGLRHRLIHDYEGTNWKFVAEAALIEVPQIVEQVEGLLGQLEQKNE